MKTGNTGNCRCLVIIMTNKHGEHRELSVFGEMNAPNHRQFPVFPVFMSLRDIGGVVTPPLSLEGHKHGEHGELSAFGDDNGP